MATAAATSGIDWNKCIFCQKHLRSCKANCPADSKRKDVSCHYRSLAETDAGFIQFGHLPVDARHIVQSGAKAMA